MAYVITEVCIGTCDTACVEMCPVDCIHGPIAVREVAAVPKQEREVRLPGVQMFINPDECICCAGCVPVCPVKAIFEAEEVPLKSQASIEANAAFFR